MPRHLVLLLPLFVACTEPAVPPGTEAAYGLPGREHQGRRLIGKGLDTLAGTVPAVHWSVSRTGVTAPTYAVASVNADAESLTVIDTLGGVHALTDPSLIGVNFIASDGSTVRIDALAEIDGVVTYQLSRLVGATRTPLCDAGGPAVAVGGTWTRKGGWLASSRISFICADGVGHKCVLWGYGPNSGAYEPCTRMARADYCNNGTTHTLDGTEIVFYDANPATPISMPPYARPPVAPPPPVPPGTTWFEAAWKEETGEVICLSKLRWQALPVGGPCMGALVDPRKDDRAKFCDDMTMADLVAAGAELMNESSYNDIGLYQWQNGTRYFTTTRGIYGGGAGPTTPPAPGYTTPVWQGTLFTMAAVGRTQVRAYQQPATGKLISTTLAPPAGYTSDLGLIGYVSTTAIGGLTEPLMLYYHPGRLLYLTTTYPAPAGYGAPPGAAAPVRLGYALRP